MNKHIINEAEAGVRVLRFLERRLSLPRPLLYRWLRSGQVRVNKGRVKADYLLCVGDELRLPPQAAAVPPSLPAASGNAPVPQDLGPGLRLVQADKHVLLLCKDSGLPVQPGSGHTDSVSQRLKLFAGPLEAGAPAFTEAGENSLRAGTGAFAPIPAHRLDKQSSGLIVAGRTHIALRRLQELFSQKSGTADHASMIADSSNENKALPQGDLSPVMPAMLPIERRYLVWVAGDFRLAAGIVLEDYIGPETGSDGRERMAVAEAGQEGVKQARGVYRILRFMPASPCGPASLLEVELLTGRKHQIRVQCASRGHPVIGDRRYNGPFFERLLLHAYKLTLPGGDFMGESFAAVHGLALPDWPEPFKVEEDVF
ncbi:MAG: RluA family pseudouridine synthase [Deltaproteobacteria bacterium]|nr:RluA family pseudouridine synthase [Deltaproteobacteria bacterium]